MLQVVKIFPAYGFGSECWEVMPKFSSNEEYRLKNINTGHQMSINKKFCYEDRETKIVKMAVFHKREEQKSKTTMVIRMTL